MKNKRLKLIYIIFSAAVLVSLIVLFILGRTETVNGYICCAAVLLLIILWFYISRIARNKQEMLLPEIYEEAVLAGKIQENRDPHSVYFLIFETKNGERLTFRVSLETYAVLDKGEKGILKYKKISDKNSYLSLIFSEFEKL